MTALASTGSATPLQTRRWLILHIDRLTIGAYIGIIVRMLVMDWVACLMRRRRIPGAGAVYICEKAA